MAYQLNKTDGTVLTTLADSQIDQVSTDITLIGKNYSGFGEYLNENLVKMLENFSNATAPAHPIRGQLWFDTVDLKLKIYNGSEFLPVSSALISKTEPVGAAGDLWYDEVKGQLFFYNGNTWVLIGPLWQTAQGITGLVAENVLDITNSSKVICKLYCGSVLLGIFSKETFTPKNPIAGFSGTVVAGFTAGSMAGMKFNVTATNAEKLNGYDASSYIRNDQDLAVNGKISTLSSEGIVIGPQGELRFNVGLSTISAKVKGSTIEDAITITPVTRTIDFYPGKADSIINVPGTIFAGTIDVQTLIYNEAITRSEESLVIADKNIYLAQPSVGQPSDTIANGGGIILKGTTDHKLTWTTDTVAWNSTEHINLDSGKEYKINGVTVLTEYSLGSSITSAPGISNFGVQDAVEIGEGDPLSAVMRLQGPKIRVLTTGGDLQLQPGPSGEGTVVGNVALIGGPRITGVGAPLQDQDASNKKYVDDLVGTRPIVLSIDLSDNKSDQYIITNILNNLAPVNEHKDGTVARILCSIAANSSQLLNVNDELRQTTDIFSKPIGTGLAVTAVSIDQVLVPGPELVITRTIKVFKIDRGQWTFISSTQLPA